MARPASDQKYFDFSGLVKNPTPHFDAEKSEAAKEHGIARAATSKTKNPILDKARQIARNLPAAKTIGVTADDVIQVLVKEGYSVHALGNAAGALFRGGAWVCIGRRKSKRIHAHANELRVWKLK